MEKVGRPRDLAKITRLESQKISKIIKKLKKERKIISPKRCHYTVNRRIQSQRMEANFLSLLFIYL